MTNFSGISSVSPRTQRILALSEERNEKFDDLDLLRNFENRDFFDDFPNKESSST